MIDKVYDPRDVEQKWYSYWIEKGYFKARSVSSEPPFCIVIPPPNVTGVLHMGHALNNTLQDIIVRYKRMSGFNTLWLPGTDHAGIATQNVVERELAKEGLRPESIGRAAFIERVWEWRKKSGGTIIEQLKRLGSSCDWSRERFTMDEGLSRAVREVFVRLFEEGLIYRGDYIINWCPRCKTALSDVEVEHEETKGHLYYIKYPLAEARASSWWRPRDLRPCSATRPLRSTRTIPGIAPSSGNRWSFPSSTRRSRSSATPTWTWSSERARLR